MSKKIKWGIIGLGNIAHQFVLDLALIKGAELTAVASRNLDKANSFAEKHGAKYAFGSYEELIKFNGIDIIYVATPHNSHAEISIQGLTNGKHVLCEKPIALNHRQAQQMILASKSNHKFFMEAFWTRFNPSVRASLLKVKNGELGTVRYINADFAFYVDIPENSRMTKVELGGGSLLDMGVYPLFLAYLILGVPESIIASSNFFTTGADKQTSMVLQYKEAQAVLHSSFISPSNMEATISGTLGRINLHPIWHETQAYSLIKNNQKVDFYLPTRGKGFTYEIEECHHCIETGKLESELWSHQDSLNLIGMVDEVRRKTGLTFPGE